MLEECTRYGKFELEAEQPWEAREFASLEAKAPFSSRKFSTLSKIQNMKIFNVF